MWQSRLAVVLYSGSMGRFFLAALLLSLPLAAQVKNPRPPATASRSRSTAGRSPRCSWALTPISPICIRSDRLPAKWVTRDFPMELVEGERATTRITAVCGSPTAT